MSRTCRLFDEPAELGMHVMKSLMNEMRTKPRIGWVRADQARGKEDIEREQALIDDIAQRDRRIKKLERTLRDRSLPLEGILPEDLAQGNDSYPLMVTFQDANKKLISKSVPMTWDEIFSIIAPTMYGYILRRSGATSSRLVGSYSFEGSFIEYVRTKVIDQAGARQINILPHQIDDLLIQFRQLGLMQMVEKESEDGRESFRGHTLTKAGEEHLTRLRIKTRRIKDPQPAASQRNPTSKRKNRVIVRQSRK